MRAWLPALLACGCLSASLFASDSDSFASLASRAMCMADGCALNDTSCFTKCIPTKEKYINGREVLQSTFHNNIGLNQNNLELVCHDIGSIAIKFCEFPKLYYLITYSQSNQFWINQNVTENCSIILHNLEPDCIYKIEVRRFWSDGQVGDVLQGEYFTTSENLPVTELEVSSVSVEEIWAENGTAVARLKWVRSPVLPCHYDLVIWKNSSSSHPNLLEVNFPDGLDGVSVTELEFGADYHVGVSGGGGRERGDKIWALLRVPPCLHFYPSDLTRCRPITPQNFTLDEELGESGWCQLRLRWSEPSDVPESYNLTLSQYSLQPLAHYDRRNFIISGNETEKKVGEVAVGSSYIVNLRAKSPGGFSKSAVLHITSSCSQLRDVLDNNLIKKGLISTTMAIGLISLFSIIVITLFSVLLFYYKEKTKKKRIRFDYFKTEKKLPSCMDEAVMTGPESDEFEVCHDRLQLSIVVGEGAFGVVRKALLSRLDAPPLEVAVKMLPDNPTSEERREFEKEIAVMKTVGQHRNIVSLIGCCTRSHRLLLIVEFCALGDLQNYLRQEWKKQTESLSEALETANIKYPDLMSLTSIESYSMAIPNSNISPDIVNNAMYELITKSYNSMVIRNSNISPDIVNNAMYDLITKTVEGKRKELSERLLSFARQIAVGMEYLASNRVVHRDLAARNILVCSDESIKISDFGLSRDVYEQNVYHKKSSEKLPVKWMALESLLHQIYTTQSDVWSFGVVLWEIVTLGGNPYPCTPTSQMFRLLKQGFRMEQPPACSNELYTMMLACWKEKPSERPTFTSLVHQLTILLEGTSPHQYLDLAQLGSWA